LESTELPEEASLSSSASGDIKLGNLGGVEVIGGTAEAWALEGVGLAGK